MNGESRIECHDFKVDRSNDREVVVDTELYCRKGNYGFTVKTKWTIYDHGYIRSENAITPDFASAPISCLGFVFELPGDFDQISYIGQGPQENYIDRRTATWFDTFHTSVKGMFTKYSKTQHYGNRTGVSQVILDNYGKKDFSTLFFRCENNEKGMEFTATQWTQKEIADAKTPDRLPPSDKTVLELDIVQAPLGGNSCGPVPLEQYITRADRGTTFKLDYVIIPR